MFEACEEVSTLRPIKARRIIDSAVRLLPILPQRGALSGLRALASPKPNFRRTALSNLHINKGSPAE